MKRVILNGLLAVTCLCWSACAFAEAKEETSSSSKTGSSDEGASKVDAGALPTLSQNLTELHDTVKHLKHAATNLIGEMSRTELKILEYDDYINQYVDDKPVAYNEQLYPYGFQNIGNTSTTQGAPMKPRKKWVDYYVKQLADHISSAQDWAKRITAQPIVATQGDLADRMTSTISALQGHLATMKQLTDTQDYDKVKIQSEAQAIRDEGGDIDMCSRKLYRVAKERAKANVKKN